MHESGVPFADPNGDPLRDWMGIGMAVFSDAKQVAILPMALAWRLRLPFPNAAVDAP
jgi:hypothetical protein